MQQAQQNYRTAALSVLALFVALSANGPLLAAPIVQHQRAAPLLSDGKPGPCDPRLDQPDYRGEVDVRGNPVAPADVPAARNPVPDGVLVPLNKRRGQGPLVALDGVALDPLLNPKPSCLPKAR